MEKVLHDVLNAGIALFRAGEDTLNNAVKEVTRTYEELKSKGASDTSEPAVKLRKLLDDVVTQVNEVSSKADATAKDVFAQVDTQYKQISEQIQQMVPEDQVNQIKDKIEELAAAIKEKTGGSASA